MNAFQKFIFLSISIFVVVGSWQLLAGVCFFKPFTLDLFGFLAVIKFIIPALVFVYYYEELLERKNVDIITIGIEKTFFISYFIIIVFHSIIIFLVLYFGTKKIDYLHFFDALGSANYFMYISIININHKKNGIVPILRLNEKPVFYLKQFVFSIIGVIFSLFFIYAFANLTYDKTPKASSSQFMFDCFVYAMMAVPIANFSAFGLNRIAFFRKSIVLPFVFTTAITFCFIKLIGYPQNYFRIFIKENVLLMITLFLCLMTVILPIARSKRNLKFKSLTSNLSKKEAEYLQLKNQINPHFLFNNLNVLVSFIELDPKKAIEFGHHLSNVYRHYLKNQTEDYVSLQVEINFITEYLAIYKAKFEKGFVFRMPEQIAKNQYILPNCLQELIDNVFKHNVITDETPLEIEIFIELNSLVIQNTMNKKEVEIVSNFGLENIKKRYLLLTNTSIEIIDTSTHFSVKIPILELQS